MGATRRRRGKPYNASGADDTQEEADLFMPTSNHFEQDERDQAPTHSTQEATVDDEPIAVKLKEGFNMSNLLQMRQPMM